MPVVVPTITEESADGFTKYLRKLSKFAHRIHVDLADGVFTPRKLADLGEINLPDNLQVDLHLMYQRPYEYLEDTIKRAAHTTIVHAEAQGDLLGLVKLLHESNLRAGIALLPTSQPQDHRRLIEHADYVLIFGGKLGWQGGDIDLYNVEKIADIRRINPHAEIAWDGGINDVNIDELVRDGVDVLNVGGFIHGAKKPQDAYAILQQIANG